MDTPAWLRAALLAPAIVLMGAGPQVSDAYRREIEQWRHGRVSRLTADGGWLAVVGLSWLEPGKNAVGSGPGNRVVLPDGKTPSFVGTLDLEGGRVTLHAAPGAGVTSDGKPVSTLAMTADADGPPAVVAIGPVSFFVIRRGDRLGVRVKDKDSEARRAFGGIESYPIDPKWRVEARFEPYDPHRKIPVPTVLGTTESSESPGALVFEVDGKTFRLDPVLEEGETDLFVIFGDRTNGTETYGAGRFLYAAPPRDGRTVLDFNKAYNPPCVFTAYATCPLPPSQNKLPIRIDAGEKVYGKH